MPALWENIPEDLLQDAADFDQAIRIWAAWTGRPLVWNEWQMGVAKVRSLFQESAPPKGPDYKALLSSLRDEVMEDIHGPMWKRSCMPPPKRAPSPSNPPKPSGEGGPAAAAIEDALPAEGVEHFHMSESGARSLPAASVAGSDAGGRAASVRSLPAVRTPEAARAIFAGEDEEPAPVLRAPPVIPMLLSKEASAIMEDHGADASESSSACMGRTREMASAMRASGVQDSERDLGVSIELYARDLISVWQQEAATTGSTDGVRAWALQVLTVQDFGDAQSQYELESQVRALAMLAGLDYAAASRQVARIWSTTPAGSAAMRDSSKPSCPSPGPSGGLRSFHFSTPRAETPPPRSREALPGKLRGTPPRQAAEPLGGTEEAKPAPRSPSFLSPQVESAGAGDELVRTLQDMQKSNQEL